jgi:integrase
MARLTDLRCRTAAAGTYSDGGGLLLRVRTNAAGVTKAWTYRYTVDGKQTWLGLGGYPDVSLAQAREKAADARKLRADGNDPLVAKRAERASLSQQRAEQLRSLTFDQAAAQYIQSHRAGWRNHRHAQQWQETLRTYCSPVFGSGDVADVDLALVLKALEPMWRTVPETASRVRGRIELILNWAKARGLRSGENPAAWRGNLQHLLPRPSKLKAVRHHSSLPYADLPAFMATLRELDGVAAAAMQFLILTAARSSEVRNAKWSEVNLATGVWAIEGSRMKSGRPHRVALSEQAMDVLRDMAARAENEFIFPGARRASLSAGALDWLLRYRLKLGFCAHGMRSSFRVWAAERTAYPREIIEACLAHQTASAVEQAYLRTDHLERRRQLMQAWGRFCDSPASSQVVVPLRALAT